MMNRTTARLTDEELALESQAGSRCCFEELIERYTPKLFNFLRPKIASNQDKEDIIQETFFKLYKNIFRYNPKWKFSTWIFTSTYRTVISFYRSRKKKIITELPAYVDDDPAEILIKENQAENIWKLARNLKSDHYDVLWLRYVEEMPSKEIAKIMGKTHLAVRSLLHRARLNLSKQFQYSPEFENHMVRAGSGGENLNYTENQG